MRGARSATHPTRAHGPWIGMLTWAICLSTAWWALGQDLPQQIGSINDYAAALGGKAQRQPLESFIEQLQADHQVSLVFLLSERDPFDDLERYGLEVQRAWGLPQQRQVFALFLKGERRWYVRAWVSADLMGRAGADPLERLQEQVDQLAQRNHLQEATQRLAVGLLEILSQADTPLALAPELSPWVFLVTVIVPCLLVLWLFLRWARSFCPRCVKPLHRSKRGGKTLLYCPNCGYNR